MNIAQYISSGILEAYVLGELNPIEILEVERNLATYPELKEELRQIELTQERLMQELAIAPSAKVKNEILNKISEQQVKVVEVGSRNSVFRYSIAASIALALVSSVLAFRYYYKWRQADSSLTELLAQNQRIASDYNTVNQRLDKIESDLKITSSSSYSRVEMSGTDNAKNSKAYVYWNVSTNDVYLSIENMRELSKENQFQLWAIVDGKPVDAGVFDSTFSGLLKMKNISGASAFAVTIEKRGGAPSPALETMQVVGNVVKG